MKKIAFDEKQVRSLYKQGLNDREIGEIIGTSKSNVRNWRAKNKLPSVERGTDKSRMLEMYMDGYEDQEIADELGCNKATVTTWRNKNDYPHNAKLFFWQLALSEEQIKKIPQKYVRCVK